MDEISREKEEYFADGVLWSDNHAILHLTRKPCSKVTCGSELNLAPACHPISIECRERFRQRLRRIIHHLRDLVRANPFSKEAESSTNAPLSTNFWTVLSKLEVDEVFNILLSHFPEQVQVTLGKPTVTIDGLLALPHQADNNLGGWIVYIDIVTESVILDDGKETGSIRRFCHRPGRWNSKMVRIRSICPQQPFQGRLFEKGLSSLVLYKAWSHNEPSSCCCWILPSQLYVLAGTY
jgi:hypothetical protein